MNKYWRKWSPVPDEDCNEINIKNTWTEKQKALGLMRKRKRKLMDRIYFTYYDEFSLLVCFKTGKVYLFDRFRYDLKIRENKIFLMKKSTGEEKLVYDGNFHATPRVWLRESSRTLGSKKCPGVEWGIKGNRLCRMFVKNHQLIAVLYFGEKAIYAVEQYSRDYDINHRNLNAEENRVENLEVITQAENRRHGQIMWKILMNKRLG